MGRDDHLRREASAWLARLLAPDGEAARAAFEAWRAADPRHQAAYAQVEQSWQRSMLLKHSPLTWNPVMSGVVRPRRRWRPLVAGLTAATALASAAFLLLSRERSPHGYTTAVGEIRTVALPDGSRVTLDTQSRIALDYSKTERRVRLERGRARFAVAHDGARPFVVTAGFAQIVDRGTVFDVGFRGRAVDVLLLQGAVDVRPIASGRPVAATLAPGQRLLVDPSSQRLAPVTAPSAARAWTTGTLAFEDSPLQEVLAEANRYSATAIVVGDPSLARLRVTGGFRTGAPIDLARNLAALFSLRIVTLGDDRIVLMPPAQTAAAKNGG